MSFRFQFRRGTTAERNASNPILAAGEPAVVLDSGQPAELVLGDGVTAMADLRAAVWDDDARLALADTATQPGDLGTAAAADAEDFATTAQGAKADTAVQPADLAPFATAGQVRSHVATDGTDQTATLNAELAALHAAGGGTLILPSGTIRCDGTLTLTNDAATPPKQPALRIVGQGAHWSGRGTAPIGGTTLDIRGAGTNGKITTTGLGLLAIEGVTLRDTAGTSTPFLYTTNTTLHVDGCAFVGSKTSGWDQDGIVLGGPDQVEGGGALTDGFQGYGTVISRNFFSGIRTIIKGQAFANAVVIRDNTVWTTCGNTTGAAIEWDGQPTTGTQSAAGCLISGNLIEVPNYAYAIRLKRCTGFTLDANNVFDADTPTVSAYVLDAECSGNVVREGYTPAGLPALDDTGTNNWFYATSQGVYSNSPPLNLPDINYPTKINRLWVTGQDGVISYPTATRSDETSVIAGFRADGEASRPGQLAYQVKQSGEVNVYGNAAGNMNFYTLAGDLFTTFNGAGRNWIAAGTGGYMSQNSGTGGSYFDLKNYGVRFYDHNAGPLRMRIGAGKDGFDLGASSDLTVQRDASGNLAVNADIEVTDTAGGIILKSPDGTRYRVTVANGGTLNVATA